MTMKISRHPYAYSLDLLRFALERLPASFSQDRKNHYVAKLKDYAADKHVDYENIRSTVTELGRESWPHRCAFEDIYEQFGRISEEANLLKNMDTSLRGKYERFLHEGGKINMMTGARSASEMTQPSPFERYFTPEEKFAIEQALLAARETARAEIASLVAGKKKQEYDLAIREHIARQARLSGMIEELRGLAKVNKKWEAEILNTVRTIEEGWSVVERQPDEERLIKELEYWRGTLETFLK